MGEVRESTRAFASAPLLCAKGRVVSLCIRVCTCVNFIDEAAKTPHVDLVVVRLHQNDFRRAVVSALDICELLIAFQARRAEVDELDSRLPVFLEDHVLRFDVTVDYTFLCVESGT